MKLARTTPAPVLIALGVNIYPEEFGAGFGAGYAASLINQLAH